MINSGAKVTIEETQDGVVVSIFPAHQTWQRVALITWAIVWTMTGLLALVGMLKEINGENGVFLFVFMAFWAYFLFYAVRSIIWMTNGIEYIRVGTESLDYKRSWGGYGTAKSYDLSTIKDLGLIDYSTKKFAKSYNDAFWTMGGEAIGFEYIGQKVAFGFKLSEKDAKQLVRRIEKARQNVAG
jgi:hypothetical protein